MSTDVVVAKRTALELPDRGSLSDTMEVVRAIANTDFVPRGIRGNQAAILACVLYGREIGLGPMESLSEVHMIEGKPSLSAKAKVKRARQIGHDIWGEVTDTAAFLHGKRGDNGREMTAEFTLEDAKRAGLLGKDNWKKYPEDMLWARAVSRLCRRLFTEDGMLTAADPDEAEEAAASDKITQAVGELPPVDVEVLAGRVSGETAEGPSDVGLMAGGAPPDVTGSEHAHTQESSSAQESFTDIARDHGLIDDQSTLA